MLTSYFESTGFDYQRGRALKDAYPPTYEGYKNWTTPVRTMCGIGDDNRHRIVSNCPDDDARKLIGHIQKSNYPDNKRVADLTNFFSVTASQIITGAVAFAGTNTVWHDQIISFGSAIILGVTDGMAFSKVVEQPVRQIIDAIRKPIQEKNTRRFLESEGIV